jgi:hypothetical protein
MKQAGRRVSPTPAPPVKEFALEDRFLPDIAVRRPGAAERFEKNAAAGSARPGVERVGPSTTAAGDQSERRTITICRSCRFVPPPAGNFRQR